MERTTDLNIVRNRPSTFTWGKVQHIHEIGPYQIVEYEDRHDRQVSFHVYVDGKCTNTSAGSLEGALLLAIARKSLEVNEARYMAMGAAKLLGVKP